MDTILLLGASADQLFAIRTAKEMGLRVLVVDMNPKSPGFALADDYAVISTRDVPALKRPSIRQVPRGWGEGGMGRRGDGGMGGRGDGGRGDGGTGGWGDEGTGGKDDKGRFFIPPFCKGGLGGIFFDLPKIPLYKGKIPLNPPLQKGDLKDLSRGFEFSHKKPTLVSGETGRQGDGETGERGDGETGGRGDGETGRRGDRGDRGQKSTPLCL